jgi:uncharacterized protein involved in tolerance to divalent cations
VLLPDAFYQVTVSSTSEEEAAQILDALTKLRLAAGGLITQGQSQYWWQGERVKKTYFNLSLFTIGKHRDQLIQQVRSLHADVTPIIAFVQIADGNQDFLDWINLSVQH